MAAAAVGIDDLNVYASGQSLDFTDLARSRGLPERALRRAGFRRRSVVPVFEDPVTLAANAARPLVAHDGGAVGLLIVATETGLDFGKPLSTWVHGALGLRSACRNFELKHACFGGAAALLMAAAWVREAPGGGRKALVVTTDIARRHLGDPAELTVGAGATAAIVAEAPRVAALVGPTGQAAREVYDVARPTATTEVSDAVLSLCSYLDLLDAAYADYRRQAGGEGLARDFRHALYHAPLLSLVEQAHRAIAPDDPESFARMVAPSLGINREIANVYSGSLFASLAGLLSDGPVGAGERVACFSYGSGACAECFALELAPGAGPRVARHGIREALAARLPMSLAAYEASVASLEAALTARDLTPALRASEAADGLYEQRYEGRGLLVLDRVADHRRSYRWT